jgi:hypothetical protein
VLRYRLAGKPATPAPEQAKACWYQWFMATARRHRAFDPEKAASTSTTNGTRHM